MNPLSINPLTLLGCGVLALVLGFGAGWTANGWRLHRDIAEIKQAQSDEKAKQSQKGLDDLATAAKKVNEAATSAHTDVSVLGQKLDAIDKEFKNAKPAPLPPDCHLDDRRLRRLTDAAAAVNESALGLRLSRELQGN